MIDFLSDVVEYGAKWTESSRELLSKVSPKIFKRIQSAEVIMSPGCHNGEYDFDGSLQILMHTDTGTVIYQPLSTLSSLEEGDQIDVDTLVCIELTRPGDEPCYKMDGDLLDDKEPAPAPKKRGERK